MSSLILWLLESKIYFFAKSLVGLLFLVRLTKWIIDRYCDRQGHG
jgi:hypothetical protein